MEILNALKDLKIIVFHFNVSLIILVCNNFLRMTSALKMKCSYENITWKSDRGDHFGFEGTISGKFEVKQRGIKINEMIRNDPQNYPQPENYGDESKLVAMGRLIWYFPKGLEKYFGGAMIMHIINCQLKEIKQDDLKVFPNLESINFDVNQIEALEKDLFKYNPNLTVLKLKQNVITYIDANVFNHLNKLESVNLVGNECINTNARNKSTVVGYLIVKISNNCQKYGILEEKKKINKSGTQKGKYFWILVGCGIIVGIFIMLVVAKIIYGVIKSL